MEFNEKTATLLLFAELLGFGLFGIYGYAKLQYYRGQSEGKREAESEIRKLRKELSKRDIKLAKKGQVIEDEED